MRTEKGMAPIVYSKITNLSPALNFIATSYIRDPAISWQYNVPCKTQKCSGRQFTEMWEEVLAAVLVCYFYTDHSRFACYSVHSSWIFSRAM